MKLYTFFLTQRGSILKPGIAFKEDMLIADNLLEAKCASPHTLEGNVLHDAFLSLSERCPEGCFRRDCKDLIDGALVHIKIRLSEGRECEVATPTHRGVLVYNRDSSATLSLIAKVFHGDGEYLGITIDGVPTYQLVARNGEIFVQTKKKTQPPQRQLPPRRQAMRRKKSLLKKIWTCLFGPR